MLAVLVPAGAAILSAAITWFLGRQKDREAIWRETRLRHYEEFIVSLSATIGPFCEDRDRLRWAQACNVIHLVAPPAVLEALYAFQDATRAPIQQLDVAQHDATLTALLAGIRKDLGLKPPVRAAGTTVRLWAARKG